jgi:hypothetical protein
MRRRLVFAACAVLAAALTFRVGAALLRGDVWHFSSWEVGARRTSLWEALAHVPESRRASRSDDEFWDLQHRTLTNAGVLLLASVGVGVAIYWVGVRRGRSDEPADYKETPAGAVPDGRVGPPPAP